MVAAQARASRGNKAAKQMMDGGRLPSGATRRYRQQLHQTAADLTLYQDAMREIDTMETENGNA
jgi:hypothetical protein